MTPGVIPPSPYPVLQETRKPARTIDGPYIASKPAYMLFAEQAKSGGHISDIIAKDMQAQAKAEGRPDPVKEFPENRHLWWIIDGVVEQLPQWKNANDPPVGAAPAPEAPAQLPVPGPAPAAAPVAPPVIAPPLRAGPTIPPPSLPTNDVATGTNVAARSNTTGVPSAESAYGAAATTSRTAAAKKPAARQVSAVQQQMAQSVYSKPSKSARLAQRAAIRAADPRLGNI